MFRLLLPLLLVLLAQPAVAKSLALVIGNDEYIHVPHLQKARADAAGYATLLQGLGFEVTLETDTDARALTYALAGFLDRIEPGDTVAFVYAGHGWSDGRQNYLVPVDAEAQGTETLLSRQSFPLRNGANGILDEIAARGPGLTLAIIDACRNNPFTLPEGTRSVGRTRGLVAEAPPTGTFIAFSAGEGQTALDRLSDTDPEPNSVFTRVFLQELSRPQDLQSAFKTTQARVNDLAATVGHPQRPAYYDEVIGSACLSGDCRSTPVSAPADDPVARAQAEWEDFRHSTSTEALRAFAERHPGTPYAALAEERIALLDPAAAAPGERTAAPADPVLADPAAGDHVRPAWCARADSPAEAAICADPGLASLDIRLGEGFAKVVAQQGAAQEARLKAEQYQWMLEREACGGDIACLNLVYGRRIQALMR